MNIVNKYEVERFCWEHRDNGCDGIKGGLLDEEGIQLNMAWRDKKTSEEIKIKYDCPHDKLFNKAEDLWKMLDDISTAGDAFKPDLSDPFVKYVLSKCEEKNKHFISDGYDLFVTA